MAEFCEYMGPFGSVCMQPQARHQTLDNELLRYCDMHLAVVRRARARPKHHFRQLSAESHTSDQHTSSLRRSRSEPYGRRSHTRRVTVVEGLDNSDSDDEDASRSLSSPLRPHAETRQPFAPSEARAQTHGNKVATEAGETRPVVNVRRKRVRVKMIVIPPLFEVLDSDEPPTPPKVWYVRLAERAPGDPGNPDDDEYIEVDAPNDAPAHETTDSNEGTIVTPH